MSSQAVHFEQPTVSIDNLPTQKSLLDFSANTLPTDFNLEDHVLSKILDDTVMVEYIDVIDAGPGGMAISRGGIAIPLSNVHNAWRKAKVVLKGQSVKQLEVGEIVLLPHNMGIGITNVEVEGYGKVKNGLFIREQAIFGACKPK